MPQPTRQTASCSRVVHRVSVNSYLLSIYYIANLNHRDLLVAAWHSCNTLVSISKVNLHEAGLVDRWPCPGSTPGAGHLSRYVTSHPGQLSLAVPSWVGVMSTSQMAVMPCGWGVKAGMVRVRVAGKTVWSRCYTRIISECFRDKALYKFTLLTYFPLHLLLFLLTASLLSLYTRWQTLVCWLPFPLFY